MKRHIIMGSIIAVGVILGVIAVIVGVQNRKPAEPIAQPAKVPYERLVSGVGIVEANTENIEIAAFIRGVVTHIYVKEGEQVKRGQPLFSQDIRQYQAELRLRQADLKVAQANLEQAKAELREKKILYSLVQSVTDKRAVSIEEIDKRREAVNIAQAQVYVFEADIERAQAQIDMIKTDIERSTIRSPIDGEVLRINTRLGQYAETGELIEPLMLLGSTNPLHVRVDIDETDAWRFSPKGKAFAVIRGNPKEQIPLKFVRIEPYVAPKMSLTGDVGERVDVRVLQVIYSFSPDHLPVYVGQQLDVYIEEEQPKDLQ